MRELLFGPGPIIAVQQLFGPGWQWPFLLLTHLGSGVAILLLVALALWTSGRRLAYALAAAAVLSLAASALLWALVGLPRPSHPEVEVYAQVATSSFPSGHVATTVALWGLLALLGHIPLALAVAVILISMVSRLYLGVHFLGGVLGGLVLGLVVLGACYAALPRLTDWAARQSFRLYLVLGGVAMGAATLGIPFAAAHQHPEFWGAIGWTLGGVTAALLEYRDVRFAPAELPWPEQALKIAVGLGGLALLLLAFLSLSGRLGAMAALPVAALAALWAVLIAPVIFVCAGLGHAVEAGADPSRGHAVPGEHATRSRGPAAR